MHNSNSPANTAYRIGHWPVQLIGYGCACFVGVLAYSALISQQFTVAFFALPWLLLSLYLGLRTGHTTITDALILHECPLGHYRIAWDDLTEIEYDRQGNCWIFHGRDQRLVIPGRIFWTGSQKYQAQQLVDGQIERRSIPVRESISAPYKISHNTRQRNAL